MNWSETSVHNFKSSLYQNVAHYLASQWSNTKLVLTAFLSRKPVMVAHIFPIPGSNWLAAHTNKHTCQKVSSLASKKCVYCWSIITLVRMAVLFKWNVFVIPFVEIEGNNNTTGVPGSLHVFPGIVTSYFFTWHNKVLLRLLFLTLLFICLFLGMVWRWAWVNADSLLPLQWWRLTLLFYLAY